ncbi:MAG: TPR end-of-group domain-containing protein [Planctomycetota bacterium]
MAAPEEQRGESRRGPRPRPDQRSRGAEGAWFGRLGQLDFDIDFFERVIARNDRAVDALRALGELAARKGLTDRAVEIDRQLVRCLPHDPLARYNLGCSLAVAGRGDEALESLRTAVELGYTDLDFMRNDPDLASLRDRPEFLGLLRP